MRTAFFMFGLLLFAHANAAVAQTIPGYGPTTILSLSPEHPKAHQAVTATIVTTVPSDLEGAHVRWMRNGEIAHEGLDATTFSFESTDLGAEDIITAVVTLANGVQVSTETIIRPVEVTLSWEADTYAPPLYKGRTLYTVGATIRAEARAIFKNEDGKIIDPKSLIYTWRRNGSALPDYSGRGRFALVMEGPKFYGSDILSVTVRTPDSTLAGDAAALIETHDPILHAYVFDPLLGVLSNRTLGGSTAISTGIIAAAPYFIAARSNVDPALGYTWRINGRAFPGNADNRSMLSVNTDGSIPSAIVALSITHRDLLLQEAKGKWNITFGTEGAFGNPFFR